MIGYRSRGTIDTKDEGELELEAEIVPEETSRISGEDWSGLSKGDADWDKLAEDDFVSKKREVDLVPEGDRMGGFWRMDSDVMAEEGRSEGGTLLE